MNLFHRHSWIEHLRVIVPQISYSNIKDNLYVSEALFERMISGTTTIVYKCSKCSKTRTQEFLGIEQSPSKLGEDVIPYRGCPCLHTTPCSPQCTCANRFSSYGCMRCCSYGSPEQQKQRAEVLAQLGDSSSRL